jgi:hypothetical protein
MYAFPPPNVGYRDMGKPPAINESIAGRYERRLLDLAERMEANRGQTIRLDADAHTEYVAWRQDMENRCRPGGDLSDMQEWVTKLGSTVARLAGLIALADGDGKVTAETMRRAVTVGRYWEAHGRIAYDYWSVGNPTLSRAGQVLDWALVNGLDRFTIRDLCRAKRSWTADQAVDAVSALVDNGWCRIVDDAPLIAGRRGVPSPTVTTHPNLSRLRHSHVPMSHMSPKQPNSLTSSSSLDGDAPPDMGHEGHDGHDQPVEISTGSAGEWSPFE